MTDLPSAYDQAVALLGRRDYSSGELAEKLRTKGHAEPDITAALKRLADVGYVDDARYARAVVTTRAKLSGWGVARIRLDLRKRRLPPAVIDDALKGFAARIADGDTDDWETRATQILQKKYGPWTQLDQNERARRLNFLLRRGFSADQALKALANTREI